MVKPDGIIVYQIYFTITGLKTNYHESKIWQNNMLYECIIYIITQNYIYMVIISNINVVELSKIMKLVSLI